MSARPNRRRSAADRRHMQRALSLAARGEGLVEPNPMVGCVLARGERVVGEGWHRRFGGPHAEINALARAGRRAKGATAYVTLEPCCHFGKTPPCTDALIAAGIRRVVAAMKDVNPLVAGKGLRRLRAAGIKVEVGLLEREAKALAAPFITFMTKWRPYVILKWAQSIDGKIATRSGESKWISSIASRRVVHALRGKVDAVIAGINTVLADDPQLTARLVKPRRIAARVVLDSRLRTPIASRLVRTARRAPTLIFTGPQGWRRRRRRGELEARGCEVARLKARRGGLDLRGLLGDLHGRGMTNVLVEGGGLVHGAFMDAGLADEARVFVAPLLIGGEEAPGPLRNSGSKGLGRFPGAMLERQVRMGPDVCYIMRLGTFS